MYFLVSLEILFDHTRTSLLFASRLNYFFAIRSSWVCLLYNYVWIFYFSQFCEINITDSLFSFLCLNSQFSRLFLLSSNCPLSTVEIKKLILFCFIVHWCRICFLNERWFIWLNPGCFLKYLFLLYTVSIALIAIKCVLFTDNLNKHVLLIWIWILSLIYYLCRHELLQICFWNRSDQIDHFVVLFWKKAANFLSTLVMVNIIQQKLPSLGGLFCGKWLWNYIFILI